MRNTLGDLNNYLFEQMERLMDDELTSEGLGQEIARSRAVSTVAKQIIENASVVLEAKKMVSESYDPDIKIPKMLEG